MRGGTDGSRSGGDDAVGLKKYVSCMESGPSGRRFQGEEGKTSVCRWSCLMAMSVPVVRVMMKIYMWYMGYMGGRYCTT